MTILAPLAAGIPPVGLGVYARSHPGAAGPWVYFVGPGARWDFVGVEAMNGPGWQAAADASVARALASGASGVVLDREDATPDATIDAIAAWIRANASRVRIGFTSYPSWRGLVRLHAGAPGLFWGSPQLYFDPATNAHGWRVWEAVFGFRLVPSIAGYVRGQIASQADNDQRYRGTPEAYENEYLASIPRAGGAIVWPPSGGGAAVPAYMQAALARRYSGVGMLALMPHALASVVDSWPGLVALVIIGLVLLALFAGATRPA